MSAIGHTINLPNNSEKLQRVALQATQFKKKPGATQRTSSSFIHNLKEMQLPLSSVEPSKFGLSQASRYGEQSCRFHNRPSENGNYGVQGEIKCPARIWLIIMYFQTQMIRINPQAISKIHQASYQPMVTFCSLFQFESTIGWSVFGCMLLYMISSYQRKIK